MLNVENLSFHYRNGPEILRQVSFSLEDGQFLAILGNNGAGKSTMLKCFNQILRVEGGHVWMDGEDLLTMTHREVAQRVAFVSQNIPSTQMTVHDVVMLGRRPYMRWGFTEEDHRIVHEAMDRLHLSDMRGRFLNELSGGERQKVMLARALAAAAQSAAAGRAYQQPGHPESVSGAGYRPGYLPHFHHHRCDGHS